MIGVLPLEPDVSGGGTGRAAASAFLSPEHATNLTTMAVQASPDVKKVPSY
jgi:hypothetical protein